MTNLLVNVIVALIAIESGGDPKAIGDGGQSIGILQIKEITVDEANRLVGHPRWDSADRWCPVSSIAICRTILIHHYNRGNRDFVSLGSRWQMPYGDATQDYVRKLRREQANQSNR